MHVKNRMLVENIMHSVLLFEALICDCFLTKQHRSPQLTDVSALAGCKNSHKPKFVFNQVGLIITI